MPEPYHRCADPSCHQSYIAHEDPQIQTCSSFKVPGFGGAFEELAWARRTVGQDNGKPIQTVLYPDARRAVTMAFEAGKAEGRDEHAETVENWGAFDYELLLLAERYKIDPELPPLEIVTQLMDRAMHEAAQTISESRPWGL